MPHHLQLRPHDGGRDAPEVEYFCLLQTLQFNIEFHH